jgi:hypothetical protein
MTARAWTGVALLVAAAFWWGGAAPAAAAKKPLPESNLVLLDRTLSAAARQLVEAAPLPAGSKVALAKAEETPLALDVERALLEALTAKRIEVWLVPATAAPAETAAVGRAGAAAPPPEAPSGTETMAELQARQRAQAAAKPEPVFDPGTGAAAGAPGRGAAPAAEVDGLPLLVVHPDEARVDYPRLYRSGLFGGMTVERRAITRLSARLLRPQSRAVYWTSAADTSLADHVAKSEVKLLEDPQRAETRGTVPSQSWQKVIEPVLVVVLVVGLVSLFYTNRP